MVEYKTREPDQTPPTDADCICGHYGPSLEHARGCPKLICFYGGEVGWDRTKKYVKNGLTYRWCSGIGTWMPVFA